MGITAICLSMTFVITVIHMQMDFADWRLEKRKYILTESLTVHRPCDEMHWTVTIVLDCGTTVLALFYSAKQGQHKDVTE